MAVIDTGSNSTRLIIADVSGGQLHEVMRQTTITRLGAGVGAGGPLRPDARQRVYDCVAGYAASIGELSAERTLVIGTSSLRRAADGEQFLADLASRFNFEPRLLDGEEEARLSFSGATIGIESAFKALVFDIGGGSTEVVIGTGGRVTSSVSLELGGGRIRESFLLTDPPAREEIDRARAHIGEVFESQLDKENLFGIDIAAGVGGTVTAFGAMDAGLESYDREVVHGWRLSRGHIDELVSRLAAMTLAEREKITVLEKGRADVIVAGGLIVAGLMAAAGLDEFTVSELDLLDGVALAMANGQL